MELKVEDLQRQLTESRMTQDQENSELLRLQDTLGNKVTELYEIHEQIVSAIRKESHSWSNKYEDNGFLTTQMLPKN